MLTLIIVGIISLILWIIRKDEDEFIGKYQPEDEFDEKLYIK